MGSASPAISRRQLLALALAVPLARAGLAEDEPQIGAVRQWIRSGIERDSSGALTRVFGLDVAVADEVLLRATRANALPDGYAPCDATADLNPLRTDNCWRGSPTSIRLL